MSVARIKVPRQLNKFGNSAYLRKVAYYKPSHLNLHSVNPIST